MTEKTANTILSAANLVKSFGKSTVLRGVDAAIYAGDFTVIMGSSGSGKSTLLYTLSGMDCPSGGSVFYRELDLAKASEKQLTTLRAKDFGFVFQRTQLVSNLTLRENILLAGLIGGLAQSEAEQHTDALLNQMNLSGAKDRLPAQVSGGEAQRAAVARAVIAEPAILFADEPTGALNKANTQEVLNLFTALHGGGQTVLLVTHDKEAALRGSRVLYLEDGAVISELSLPPYQGKDKAREETLTVWLEGLGW